MSRQGKAFTAAFLNQLTQGIKDRGTIGLAFEEKEMDRFDINKQDFKKRLLNVDTAKSLAKKLRALGAKNRHIMYYAKDQDPINALRTITQKLEGIRDQKAASLNPEPLTEELVNSILDIPVDFKDNAMPMPEFWNRTFNVFKENEKALPSDNDEAFMGNLIFAALNLNPKERVRRKLENTMYKGDYSIKDINEIAMRSEYADAFGGKYEPAQMDVSKIPVQIGVRDIQLIEKDYKDKVKEYLEDYADIAVNAFELSKADGGTIEQLMDNRSKQTIYERFGFGGDVYAIAKAYAEKKARTVVRQLYQIGTDTKLEQLPFLKGSLLTDSTQDDSQGGPPYTQGKVNNSEDNTPESKEKKAQNRLVKALAENKDFEYIQTFISKGYALPDSLPDAPPRPPASSKKMYREWNMTWGKYFNADGSYPKDSSQPVDKDQDGLGSRQYRGKK
tara:strand:+ start:103 stop:1440 length:1338 start_codon:yes stop_codon:yes gene_type:complete